MGFSNFFEGMAIITWQLIVAGMIFLLLRAYLGAFHFEVVNPSLRAYMISFSLFALAVFAPIINEFVIPAHEIIGVSAIVAAVLMVCYMFARGNKVLIFLVGISFVVISVLAEGIAMGFVALLGMEMTPPYLLFRVMLQSLAVAFIALLIMVTKKINPAKEESPQLKEGRAALPFVLMIAGCGILAWYIYSILVRMVFVEGILERNFAILLMVGLVLIALAMVALYFSLAKQAKIKQQNAIYQQQLQFYDRYLQEKEADYKAQQILKHDQSQHFNFMLNAIENNQTEDAAAYLKQLMQSTSSGGVNAGNNLAVGSVLSYKYESIKESQIELTSLIEVPDRMKIDDVDVCIILGNLLDNAIEATKQMPIGERVIDLQIRYDAGNLLIGAKNSYINVLQKGGLGGFISSKGRQEGQQGLGLYSIRQALKKYDGTLQIETVGDKFIATAVAYGNEEF